MPAKPGEGATGWLGFLGVFSCKTKKILGVNRKLRRSVCSKTRRVHPLTSASSQRSAKKPISSTATRRTSSFAERSCLSSGGRKTPTFALRSMRTFFTNDATASKMLSGFFFWSFSSTGCTTPEKSSRVSDPSSVLKLANLNPSQPPLVAKPSRM